MNPPRMDPLRYLSGQISRWHVVDGRVKIEIGRQSIALHESRLTSKFKNGDVVRMLVRDRFESGVYDVLAYQRRGQGRLHYAGLRLSLGLSVLALALCILARVLHSDLVALPGVLLLILQGAILVHRRWVRQQFMREERWPSRTVVETNGAVTQPAKVAGLVSNLASLGSDPASRASSMSEPSCEAPLIPLEVAPSSSEMRAHSPRASVWPSEILEFTHDAIIIWEMDGAGIVYWNRAAEALYGYTREQAHGQVTHELLETELAGGVGELESRLAKYGIWVGELAHTRSDGRRVEVEGRLSLMSQEHGRWLVLEVNRDVTDRNRAEAARREMQQQMTRLREQRLEE